MSKSLGSLGFNFHEIKICIELLELSFNSNEFGRVLLVKPSMFGKLEVHVLEAVWRFEPITFNVRELRVNSF